MDHALTDELAAVVSKKQEEDSKATREGLIAALQESELRFRNLVEMAPETIFLIDTTTGDILDINRNATKLFGYSHEQLLKMKGIDLSPRFQPDGISSLEFINEKIKEALNGKSVEYEWMHKNSKGQLFPCEVRIVHFPPYDKKIIRGTIIDISERKKIEKQLQESEERYKSLVKNAPETIFIIDADTNEILDFTDSAQKLFGYTRTRLLKMKALELSPKLQPSGESSLENGSEHVRKALKGKVSSYEWYHKNSKGGIFPCEVRITRLPDQERKLIRGTVVDISEKKELERKLWQHGKEYEHLASISPVGIFKSDTKGKCVYVNKKWSELTGLSKEDALGDGWIKALHPDGRKDALKEWQDSVKKKVESVSEFRFKAPDGKVTWVYGHAKPDYDENGNFIGYVGSVTDVTEMIKTRDALAASEQTKNALLNAIPDMLFRLSKDGTYLDYKAAAGFGPLIPPEVFLGKKITDSMPPELAALCMKNLKAAFKTKSIQTYSYSLPDQDHRLGSRFYEARIVCSDNDKAVALIRDISKQHEAELAMKVSEEKWRSLVKSAPQYIGTVDKNNRITFINYLRFLKPEQIIGKSVFKLLQKAHIDINALRKILADARKGKTGAIEFSLKNPLGELMWFNVKAASIKAHGKAEDLIIMALDITERKRAEQELLETNEKLITLYQRLETIREEEKKNIAMEIHDELGQHLTALKLGMFWLQQYIGQHRNNEMDILQIEEKVKMLIDLSGQTISSARKLAHQLRPVVLDTLGLIPALEWQIKMVSESGKIKVDFRHNVSKIKFQDAFSVALYRIIQESLTNVLRHSKAGMVSVDLHIQNKNLVLAIQDNGIGIKASDLNQPGKIGIFGMKERIQSWKGKFELSGKSNRGTSMKVTFPLNEISKKR